MQYQCILGIDFMKESKLTLDFDEKLLIIPGDQIKELPKVEKPVEIDLSDTNLGEKQKLKDLFNSFKGLFSDTPGLTHVLYYKIDTGDQGLVVSRPYQYDRVKQGIIYYHIEKILQEGTIRPIQSPYVSPVVLTRKNNDLPPDSPEAYQFAIDYRKLNAITKYLRYQLPVIDDLITNIPHTDIMSTVDLKSGYFQLAISPKDIEKTTFITRNGTFAFLRMTFGLSGDAPNFLKAINMILKMVLGCFVMVYRDDVIITSPSFNEHIDHLNQVFTLLRDECLTINKDKCHFARDKSKYLGLIISKEGIETHTIIRNPLGNMDGSQIPCATLRALASNSREQLIREQREVPELGHIYRYLENPDDGSFNAFKCEEASAQAIAKALFKNYISRYGAPISLISDNGPQFISDVFEHLSHRLDIKHIKTVTYRPQANLTERFDRTLVQMIACFVEKNNDNWDRFLHEFSFAMHTSVNETTGKTPAELFLGRKIITPFSKLINVMEDAEYVGGNTEKLFDEARQNMRKKRKTWGKYYNRKRREVNVKVNDLVLVQTHFISAAGRRMVGKFMPKFEGQYRVLEVRNYNLII
ncbi:retrovirus-related Pol polyprotein from transposon 297 [Trichonephila clavipes]|nr:retrovirus-related Pol polyprotein from transposon 297 [Trichonephila clavipes]